MGEKETCERNIGRLRDTTGERQGERRRERVCEREEVGLNSGCHCSTV